MGGPVVEGSSVGAAGGVGALWPGSGRWVGLRPDRVDVFGDG